MTIEGRTYSREVCKDGFPVIAMARTLRVPRHKCLGRVAAGEGHTLHRERGDPLRTTLSRMAGGTAHTAPSIFPWGKPRCVAKERPSLCVLRHQLQLVPKHDGLLALCEDLNRARYTLTSRTHVLRQKYLIPGSTVWAQYL